MPYIEALGAAQKKGWAGGSVSEAEMTPLANAASYVKDTLNVWLKTDLISFGLGFLQRGDWPVVAGMLGRCGGSAGLSISASSSTSWR